YVPLRALCEFRPESMADILCLDIHEDGVEKTISEVRRFHDACWNPEDNVVPCVLVLGNMQQLNKEETWLISQELESAGGIFHAWSDDCQSFAEAFDALGRELSRMYGSINGLRGQSVERRYSARESRLVRR